MLRPHSPTVREGPTPYTGWAHLQGGQRSVSLEYQTCTSAYLFDTLVTGKGQTVRKLQNKEQSKIKKSKMIQNEDVISKVDQHSAKSKIKN